MLVIQFVVARWTAPPCSAFQDMIVVSGIPPYRPIVKPVDRPTMNSVVENSRAVALEVLFPQKKR